MKLTKELKETVFGIYKRNYLHTILKDEDYLGNITDRIRDDIDTVFRFDAGELTEDILKERCPYIFIDDKELIDVLSDLILKCQHVEKVISTGFLTNKVEVYFDSLKSAIIRLFEENFPSNFKIWLDNSDGTDCMIAELEISNNKLVELKSKCYLPGIAISKKPNHNSAEKYYKANKLYSEFSRKDIDDCYTEIAQIELQLLTILYKHYLNDRKVVIRFSDERARLKSTMKIHSDICPLPELSEYFFKKYCPECTMGPNFPKSMPSAYREYALDVEKYFETIGVKTKEDIDNMFIALQHPDEEVVKSLIDDCLRYVDNIGMYVKLLPANDISKFYSVKNKLFSLIKEGTGLIKNEFLEVKDNGEKLVCLEIKMNGNPDNTMLLRVPWRYVKGYYKGTVKEKRLGEPVPYSGAETAPVKIGKKSSVVQNEFARFVLEMFILLYNPEYIPNAVRVCLY